VLDGDGVAVVHAASQDLEVLDIATSTVPSRLFDTQIAAGFLGMASPSLAVLHERVLGRRLPKADRLTDWLRRPLSDDQLAYAASDVAGLLTIHDHLASELAELGRLRWALDECELARRRSMVQRDPDQAFRRIKEVRHLRGDSVGVARAVAAWRERRAAQIDQPVRFVLPDIAVVGIAQKAPTSRRELKAVRGLEERHLRSDAAAGILDAVAQGRSISAEVVETPRRNEVARELRPAVTLISAWVSQLARDQQLDTALLATRADLEALLRGDEDARLASGWRAELVGEPIRQLIEGRAALAFDGAGTLRLERRSHEPLEAASGAASGYKGGQSDQDSGESAKEVTDAVASELG
jgi:ribonuclease D